MKLTALGIFVGVVPVWNDKKDIAGWCTVAFGGNGNWRAASNHATEAAAKQARSSIFKNHRQIAREKAARRRSRA